MQDSRSRASVKSLLKREIGKIRGRLKPPAYRGVWDVETIDRRRLNLLLALVLGLAGLPVFMLYVLLVMSSFANTMLSGPDIFSARYSIENWRMLFEGRLSPAAGQQYTTRDIIMIIVNTLVVALGVTAVVLVVSVMAGYAISRMRFRGRTRLMELMILLHAFPGVALIIAVYAIYVWTLGFIPTENTFAYKSYMMVYTVFARAALEIPMSIWLMKGFFDKIPWEVEWSALVDGASRFKVWREIIIPLVKPGISALAIFAFLAGWEDLIYVHVFLYPEIKTLATFIEEVVGSIETTYLPVVAAAGTLYLLPTILFFVLTQQLLLQALSGGVKA